MANITYEDIKIFIAKIKEIYGGDFPTGIQTYRTIYDMAYLCALGSSNDTIGSIGIGKLNYPKDTYLVTLGGTELMNKEEALGFGEDVLSAFGADNEYNKLGVKKIKECVPDGSKIIIAGYSLGSMVMQQVLTDNYIKKHYKFVAKIGVGCPTIEPYKREKITRINDEADFVRKLSMWEVLFPFTCRRDKQILRDGNYKTTIGGHALSYVDKKNHVWDNVDVLGQEYGLARIVVDFDNMHYYLAKFEEDKK